MRAYRSTRGYRRIHWPVVGASAAVVGVLVYSDIPGTVAFRASIGLVVAAVTLAGVHMLGDWINVLYLRANHRPMFAGRDRIDVEVEVQESALVFRQGGTSIQFDWGRLSRAERVAGGGAIWGLQGIVGYVPDRAFGSAAEIDGLRASFVEAVNSRTGLAG
ncbi:MAG TPA: hypothetical protein VF188_13115 [Longimicrobiales bacterium]